jgi:hypothetical protein
MKQLVLIFMTMILSGQAFAIEITEIKKPAVRCAINGEKNEYVFNHAERLVWYSEAGTNEGLVISVSQYQAARCLGCYTVRAKIMYDIEYVFNLAKNRDGVIGLSGTMSGKDIEDKLRVEEFEGTCYEEQN